MMPPPGVAVRWTLPLGALQGGLFPALPGHSPKTSFMG